MKMVLEFHYPGVPDPDAAETQFDDLQGEATGRSVRALLSAMYSAAGGLKLCYTLMSSALLQACRILYAVTNTAWTWYATEAKLIKTPKQSLKRLVKMGGTEWRGDSHFRQTIQLSLYTLENIHFVGITPGNANVDKTRWQGFGSHVALVE